MIRGELRHAIAVWDAAFPPYWPRMRAALEADIVYRGRQIAPVGDAAPLILYPARGQGAMWEPQPVATSAALVGSLGRVRAELLTVLSEPASSTDLGVRFGVTTSAVGQHLRALRDAGLVSSTRYGRSVLYLRSDLGTALVPGSS